MMLSYVILPIRYPDDSVKRQSWPIDFIAKTDRLVFVADLMEQSERRRFLRPHRNWKRNPCMVRYRNDGQGPEFICKRGKTTSRVSSAPRSRGWAVGIQFIFADAGTKDRFYFTEDWIRGTGALKFHSDPRYPHNGGYMITRVASDRSESDLDIPGAGIFGNVPWTAETSRYTCGYKKGDLTFPVKC
jgi:hypothetical protein